MLTIFILITLLVSGVGLASSSISLDGYPPFDGYRMEPEKYGKYAEPRSDIKVQQTHNVYIPTTYYNQNDSRWAKDIMQTTGQTISDAGCVITSASMGFRTFGILHNPKTFNIAMGNYACPFYWYEAADRAGYGLAELDTLIFSPSKSKFYDVALNALLDGTPIILGYQQHNSDRSHYVLVNYLYGTGYNMSDYRALDPLGTSGLVRLDELIGNRPLRTVAVYHLKN